LLIPAAKMEKALGKKETFGSKDGLTSAKLRKYHYTVMMPYFTDHVELGEVLKITGRSCSDS